MQWKIDSFPRPLHCHYDRCVEIRVRVWWTVKRYLADAHRRKLFCTYIYQNWEQYNFCAIDLSPGPKKSDHTVTNRQQICSGIYQPYGRNSFVNPEFYRQGNLEWAIQINIHLTAVHIPGIENVKADYFEQALPRSDGMEAESASISRNCSRPISSSGRLVRQSFELSAPKVCVLATGSNSMENGCSLNTMEKSKSLCFPAFQPYTTISSESETRQSPNNLSNSLLDNTTLVP